MNPCPCCGALPVDQVKEPRAMFISEPVEIIARALARAKYGAEPPSYIREIGWQEYVLEALTALQAIGYPDMLDALHAAIDRPKGVVPESAEPFYNPALCHHNP